MAVQPHGELDKKMEPLADEVENLLVPKPGSSSQVDFQRRGFEEQTDATVLQRCNVSVEALPLVGNNGDAADGAERVGNPVASERRSV